MDYTTTYIIEDRFYRTNDLNNLNSLKCLKCLIAKKIQTFQCRKMDLYLNVRFCDLKLDSKWQLKQLQPDTGRQGSKKIQY